MTVVGWVERPNGRRAVDFLTYLKHLKAEGFDVTALVASDYSHVVAVICEGAAICSDAAKLSWLEPHQLELWDSVRDVCGVDA